MNFIYSKPAQRFDLISNILGLEDLNNLEEALNQAVNHFTKKLEFKDNEKSSLLTELSENLGREVQDISSVLDILNDRLTNMNLMALSSLDKIDSYVYDLIKRFGAQDEIQTKTINKIREMASSIIVSQDIKNKMKEVKTTFDNSLEKHLKKIPLISLLKEGKQILAENYVSKCPLCEHKIDRSNVLEKIEKNLILLTSISDTTSKIKADCQYIVNGLQKIKFALDEFYLLLKEYEVNFAAEISMLKEIARPLDEFVNSINQGKDFLAKIDYENFNIIVETLSNASKKISEKANFLIHNETHEDESLINVINLLKDTGSKLLELKRMNHDIEIFEYHHSISERLRSLFLTTKHLKIQEIYDSMQNDIKLFYSLIHPEEDHGEIKLIVDFTKSGSTTLQVSSYDKMVDPRAFQSEGHLDSLGLCIFLAFIKRFNPECSLVILDDIVTTIDSSHRVRICKLLYEHFKDKQLIITTHDKIWYDQLVTYQRSYGLQGKFQNMTIVGWNILHGPKLLQYKPRIDRIREKLENGDKSGAANDIRQYMEWLLKEICEAIKADVPFKGNGLYTIGDLLIPSKRRITKLVKETEWKNNIVQVYAELESAAPIANLLSHDNPEAANISKGEIETLLKAVHNLHQSFQCDGCHEILYYEQHSGYLRCINHKCEKPVIIKTV